MKQLQKKFQIPSQRKPPAKEKAKVNQKENIAKNRLKMKILSLMKTKGMMKKLKVREVKQKEKIGKINERILVMKEKRAKKSQTMRKRKKRK